MARRRSVAGAVEDHANDRGYRQRAAVLPEHHDGGCGAHRLRRARDFGGHCEEDGRGRPEEAPEDEGDDVRSHHADVQVEPQEEADCAHQHVNEQQQALVLRPCEDEAHGRAADQHTGCRDGRAQVRRALGPAVLDAQERDGEGVERVGRTADEEEHDGA